MDNDMIVLKNVVKSFRINKSVGIFNKLKNRDKKEQKFVLDDISFSVKRGEILGIIGLNGSGKSTLLKLIAGVYTPEKGFIQINGKLSPLMQLGAGFHNDLNAKDNIMINGVLLGFTKNEMEKKYSKIIEFAELEKFSELKLKHYSSGMRARLGFSIALEVESDILLIDEILSVGDHLFKQKSYETFLNFKKNKKTIIHVTHNLKKISEFSDRILLLDEGKILEIGEPDKVIKKYLEIKSKF